MYANGKNGETLLKSWTKSRHDQAVENYSIKGINGRAKHEAENEAITFNGSSFSSSKQLATKFNQQFNSSNLVIHTSSRETRVVMRKTKTDEENHPIEIAMGFNQRKPPDRTLCLAVELWAAFDTVCHNNLLSNMLCGVCLELHHCLYPGMS